MGIVRIQQEGTNSSWPGRTGYVPRRRLAEGAPRAADERQARAGNGGGVETLWERKTWILHPFGYQFTGTDITNRANTNGRTGANTGVDELSPLLADLRKAANWDRVVDRKNVPIAFLKIKAA